MTTKHPGWSVFRVFKQYSSFEVFKGPDGVEYKRTKQAELADVTLETQCGALHLRRRDAPARNLNDCPPTMAAPEAIANA